MKILLVEDDYVYAENLKVIFVQNLPIEFSDIVTVDNYEDAVSIIQTLKIDLIISDLILEGNKTGIDLLEFVKPLNVPLILITSSDDLYFYQRAKSVKELNYLVKPIHPITLVSTIEKVFSEYKQSHLTVKDNNNNKYIQIAFDDIQWIESDRNYSTIITAKKKNAIKVSLIQLIEHLDSRFQRCHQRFIINMNHVKSLNNDAAFINDIAIPVGRSYKRKLVELIK